ncbi:alpha-galactosidase [Sphingobacterium sp. SRCM116780]|uniref:alpha-galactosidase n=1 Tax=Sphingobacterium sp. SRCM116780 TaxID=2907623 RepID=UPI001F2A1F86|nr:alpha-galactosidase [Sphingobacterium sp. SRCM116780]UIR54821.1 alpha-galactosidase [Sphingobacterium sp. SRCM116780]
MRYILGIFLVLVTAIYLSAQPFQVKKNGIVWSYNKEAGTYSISQNNNLTIKNAIAYTVLSDGTRISSDQIKGIKKISEQPIQDKLGRGTHYTVLSKIKNGLEMKQHFFLYDQKPIILVQLEINGKNIASNEMAPLWMESTVSSLGKSLYQVAVPFDNDAFISYENEPLSNTNKVSAEIGVIYDRESQHGLLIGSLDQSVWKSGIAIKGNQGNCNFIAVKTGFTDVNITRDSMEHGFVKGDRVLSPKYLISYVNDWRAGMEEYAKIHRQLLPPYVQQWKGATPVGWNSWGVIQDKINFHNATATARYFVEDIPYFRNADGEAFIDLDSFWDNMTPGVMSGDYTQLKKFVHYCDSLGLKPGVYWAPFTDWGHGGGPERKAEGSLYTFGQMWTKTKGGYHNLDGGRALDPTHPGTLARMDVILGKLVDCGFKMIKIDFLSHAAIESTGFYDKNSTTGMQAYALGMKHLVDVLQGKMLIYAAISPSLATSQFAHMRRIACDAWKTIDQTQYTLNSVSYGWWQTYMYDFIDADHLVFHDETAEINKARLLSGIVTGTIILGDDFSKKESWQINMNTYLQNPEILKVIRDGKSFRPAGFVEGRAANQYYFKKSGKDLYVALFNFSNEKRTIDIDFKQLGLNSSKKYKAEELFAKTKLDIIAGLPITFEEAGGKLFRIAL